MDRRPTAIIMLTISLLISVASVPMIGVGAATTDVELTASESEVSVGETATVAVVVTNASGGVGAFNVTVSLSNSVIANITDVSYADDPLQVDTAMSEDKSAVTMTAFGLDTSDTGSVTIATLTIRTETVGTTGVNATVHALGNETGFDYEIRMTQPTSITVRPRPTVNIANTTVDTGRSSVVNLTLSRAPDGLAGYELNVSVTDSSIAAITGAFYPDHFGVTEDPVIGPENASVRLKAVDIQNETTPGAEDVILASITIEGVKAGDTTVFPTVFQMDDDFGGAVEPATSVGDLSVMKDSGTEDGTSTPTPTSTPPPTSTSTRTPTATSSPTPVSTLSPTETATHATSPTPSSSPTETSPTAVSTPSPMTSPTSESPSPETSSLTAETPTLLSTPTSAPTSIRTPVETRATGTPGQPGFGTLTVLLAFLVISLLVAHHRS